MSLRTKIMVYVSLMTLALAILIVGVATYAMRTFSLDETRDQAKMAAMIVKAAVTEQMRKGVIEHRQDFLARLQDVPGLSSVHLVRGDAVTRQFGPGNQLEEPLTEEERWVLQTGKPREALLEKDRVIFSYTLPYIASSRGDVNCLKCHDVPEGTVLGAVTLGVDLTVQRRHAAEILALMMLLVCVASFVLVRMLQRLYRPFHDSSESLAKMVSKASQGDFSHRIAESGYQEVQAIAHEANTLMQVLEENFGTMAERVESLTDHTTAPREGTLLERTTKMIHDMVDAIRFKQVIELDASVHDVYHRLVGILRERFGIERFSIYERHDNGEKLTLIHAEGMPEGESLWCDRVILETAEACRACRKAGLVSSVQIRDLCVSFAGREYALEEDLRHICIPLMRRGGVGSLVQLVLSYEQAKELERGDLATIQTYLAEAEPVVEAKRLAHSLKEMSMRDAMTGLHNRRFLEEVSPRLLATAKRRQSSIGVMMVDMDHFKEVNDTYGHDAGDLVLKDLAWLFCKHVRESDLVFRLGGEEFLLLLVDADPGYCAEVGERIRSSVEQHAFAIGRGEPIQRTVSIGVAVLEPGNEDLPAVIKWADEALYEAKETGRNRVVVHASEVQAG